MLVTPAIPGHWPPQPHERPAALVRYAFAFRLAPHLADGSEVAAPWARSLEGQDGSTAVQLLRTELRTLGVQGVRPLRPEESALLGEEAQAAALLRRGEAMVHPDLVRSVTCSWAARNGVIAAAIAPLHAAFFRWLAC
jgi:hypothetical protein